MKLSPNKRDEYTIYDSIFGLYGPLPFSFSNKILNNKYKKDFIKLFDEELIENKI